MNLSRLVKPTKAKLTRTFKYVPDGMTEGFLVTATYLSPEVVSEQAEKSKIKIVSGKRHEQKIIAQSEFDYEQFRVDVTGSVFVRYVEKITGLTWRHLSKMLVLDPAIIADNGGLLKEIPLDPSKISEDDQKAVDEGKMQITEAQARARVVAEENLIFLCKNSVEFFEWLLRVITHLELYQDEDWEAQVENLGRGPATNSASA